jgi:eukaryotic-like serine/threonine-protein kinase
MPALPHASTPPAGPACGLCGAALPGGRADAVCPSCLLGLFDGAAADELPEVPGYELLGELARGGMGVVYRARQASPDREVALKVLLPRFAEDPEMLARFEIEARAMAALDHPGILPVYEVGARGGAPFFSMKFVAGGSLADRLKAGPMDPRAAAALLASLAEAVHFAHQHGVLHRDLKPGNFLFDGDGRPYVSDFGLAKLPMESGGGLTRTGSFFGTPQYMPPEVAGGSAAESTVAGDVYALGAVLYECLTGAPPHARHQNVGSLLRAIVDEPVVPLQAKRPGLPRDLAVVCQKALEKLPGARYASAGAMADDLRCWLQGYAISARPVGAAGRLWRWSKRHPLSAALALILLSVTLAGTVLLAASHRDRGVALQESRRQLHRSLVAQARAERLLGAPGHRGRALARLREAAALAPSSEIADEVVAGLARTDLTEMAAPIASAPAPIWPRRYLDDDEVIHTRLDSAGEVVLALLSSGRAALWRRGGSDPVAVWEPAEDRVVVGDVLADGSGVVLAGTTAGDGVFAAGAGQVLIRGLSAFPANAGFLVLDPRGALAALGGPDGLEVIELTGAGASRWRTAAEPVRCRPAWSPDGAEVAVALGETRAVVVLEAATGRRLASLALDEWPEHLAFHPVDRLLAVADAGGRLTLADPSTGRLIASVAARLTAVAFSSDGSVVRGEDPDGRSRAWRLESSTVFREWRPAPARESDGTVFDLRLSPNGTKLLTTATAGVRLWSVPAARETGFHAVENQRIDATTAAWWLGDSEILVQVPGGLERVAIDADGRPGAARRVPRPPGATVLDVRLDGSWLVRLADDEGDSFLEIWPQGDAARAAAAGTEPLGASEPLTAASPDGAWRADCGSDDVVVLASVARPSVRRLTPPFSPGFVRIGFIVDSHKIVMLSRDHRVFEWDLPAAARGLESLGF